MAHPNTAESPGTSKGDAYPINVIPTGAPPLQVLRYLSTGNTEKLNLYLEALFPWDPDCYEHFRNERAAPFEDLLKMVRVREGLKVIDLGCGTGDLTVRLAEALPESEVLGIDSSAEMLARASNTAHAGLRFEQRNLTEVPDEFDLVFSNAAIQWVPDHHSLIPYLFSLLRVGGQLVVQLPSNYRNASHVLIADQAAEEPFRSVLGDWMPERPVLLIEEYARILCEVGAGEITVFEKVYPHVLADADAVADWTSGTALVPYMERLPTGLREPFVEGYRAKLRVAFPERPLFYGFRRTLFSGVKPPANSLAGMSAQGDN